MGILTGKNALIFGVANERSIAWGITKAFHDNGATIGLSYAIALFALAGVVLSLIVLRRVPQIRTLP